MKNIKNYVLIVGMIMACAFGIFVRTLPAAAETFATERENNDVMASANMLRLGQTMKGRTAENDSADWYKFEVAKNGYIEISLKPDPSASTKQIGSGWDFYLRDSARNTIYDADYTENINTGAGGEYKKIGLQKGTYYIEMYSSMKIHTTTRQAWWID